MEREKYTFHHESLQDSQSITELLQAITQGLEQGQLDFSDEDGEIAMVPHGLLHLKLKASKEEGRNRFNLSVSRQDNPDEKPGKKSLKVNKKNKSKKS